MSKFNGHHHSPGEVRNRKTGTGSARSPLVRSLIRSPADQIRHLCTQYERGQIELPELEERLEIAVAEEASENTLAADLNRVASRPTFANTVPGQPNVPWSEAVPLPPPSKR